MADDDAQAVFEQLRALLTPFEPRLLLKTDTEEHYSLDVPFSAKWKRELFFGGVQASKSYVSFHLMPVYMFPDLLDGISDGLRKRMQGKSCFNFKSVQPELFSELGELAQRGFARLEAEQLVGR